MFKVEFNDGAKKTSTKFKIEENSGGGDCLFKTITAFLKTTKEKSKYSDMNDVDVRKIIVNKVSSEINPAHMQQIKFNLEAVIPFFKSLNLEDSNTDLQKEALSQYTQHMSTPGNCGTVFELEIASEIFNFAGLIFRTKDYLR